MQIENLGEEAGLEHFERPTSIALIDADTIAYSTCVGYEYVEQELLSEDFYTEAEIEAFKDHPFYDEKNQCIWAIDFEAAFNAASEAIESIRVATHSKSCECYFSEGRNFRHDIYPEYKSNRKDIRYPIGLANMKEALAKAYNGEVCRGHEADDRVVMLKRLYPEKYVLAAVDKDVLNAVPGRHYNYYRSEKHGIEPKFVEVDQFEAYKFPFFQCLTGDSSDNIKGCKGIGKAKAEKALSGLYTPDDWWKVVKKLFKDEDEALLNMRLVNMHQLQEDLTIKFWEPSFN